MIDAVLSGWHRATVGDSSLGARYVVVTPAFASKLHTQHRDTLRSVEGQTPAGPESFSAEVGDELSAEGLAQPGQTVKSGDVVIGKTAPTDPLNSPTSGLPAPLNVGSGFRVDVSVRVPLGIEAEVIAAEVTTLESGERQAAVTIEW
ncbi:MAG: hypothetical protein AAF721_22530, partial [Myxococcota bacterium]